MTVLESFQQSNAWDQRFNLPLVPMHSNPWIYAAYSLKLIRLGKHTNDELIELVDLFEVQLAACRSQVWGEFFKWPDHNFGGNTSHDEVMGIAYIDWCLKLSTKPTAAILKRLLETDGEYNVNNLPEKIPEEHNIYRFVWMEPFLKACAGFRVGFISQLWFSIPLLVDIFGYKKEHGGESGILLKWITLEPMEKYFLSGICIGFWKRKMEKLGINPKQIFTEKYLKECPVFGENAPNKF